jgi:hypothetical protein
MFSDEVFHVLGPYRPGPGNFAKIKHIFQDGSIMPSQWQDCREIWHSENKNLKFFFFSHPSGTGKNAARFMEKFEKKVDATPSRMGLTQRKTISWVEPSAWWQSSMRRSLYTILLRSAPAYKPNKDNFRQALYSNEYAEATEEAVERFLDGYTYYTGRTRGWYKQFHKPKNLNKLLVKP